MACCHPVIHVLRVMQVILVILFIGLDIGPWFMTLHPVLLYCIDSLITKKNSKLSLVLEFAGCS
jgi:hypothetical protein